MTWQKRLRKEKPMIAREMEAWINAHVLPVMITDYLLKNVIIRRKDCPKDTMFLISTKYSLHLNKPKRAKYWIEVKRMDNGEYLGKEWSWAIVGINGKFFMSWDTWYKNKTQCVNVARKFAEYCGLEIRYK